jgi:tRNA threonylcarbamoyl adenosine modification protein YjeE
LPPSEVRLQVAADAAPQMTREVDLADEEDTRRLAEDVAAMLAPGDMVALGGGLGAGKTVFARAMIRALAHDPGLNVPSPTFPLRIDYPLPRFAIAHADLYRIGDASEAEELGLEEALAGGALIVEWPERLGRPLSPDRLDISLSIAGEGRRARIAAHGSWAGRLARSFAVRSFLDEAGWAGARRMPLVGDASARAYERLARDGATAILMNAPERHEGSAVHDGRSYDAVAHRARSIAPFVALAAALRAAGVHAPAVHAWDPAAGLALLEDLGAEPVTDAAGRPAMERYETAVDLLAFMHERGWPETVPLAGYLPYRLPPYDRDALLVEVSLFADWHAGSDGARPFSPAQRAGFLQAWAEVLKRVDDCPRTWVLRDFHSVNLLWLPREEGLWRLGVLDFQDALLGHAAYDLASLAQDARARVTPEEEAHLKSRYIETRLKTEPGFDVEAFEAAYAVLGAQRATKILGAFSRLAAAEGKSGYLCHIPHVRGLLAHNLAHPVLSPLRLWYQPFL